MSFVKDVSITFWSRIVVSSIGLIVTIIIARSLGPEGKGIYSLVILIPSLLALFVNSGIGISNIYFIGKKRFKEEDLASNSLILGLISGSITITFFLIFFDPLYNLFFPNIDSSLIKLSVLATPFLLLQSYFTSILLAKKKVIEYNLIRIFNCFILLFFSFLFLVVFHWGIKTLILIWTLSWIITSCIAIGLTKKLIDFDIKMKFDVIKESVIYGIKGHFANIFGFLNHRIDMFLINFFIGATPLGFYSIAVVLAETIWYIPDAIQTILLPKISSNTKEKADKTTPIICRNTIAISALLCFFLIIIGKFLILFLFSKIFLPEYMPLMILIPGIIMSSFSRILAVDLIGRGLPLKSTYAAFFGVLVNILLNLLFIPEWGIAGAALATTFSYSTSSIIRLYYFIKISKTNIFDILIIKKRDIYLYISLIKNIIKFS